jgi:hypothetical protein
LKTFYETFYQNANPVKLKSPTLWARLLIYRWVSKYRESKSLHNIKIFFLNKKKDRAFLFTFYFALWISGDAFFKTIMASSFCNRIASQLRCFFASA